MSSNVRLPLIATHVSCETKAAFAALAASRGLCESALLGLLIDTVLGNNHPEQSFDVDRPHKSAPDRITLRLRQGDRARIEARAALRHLKPSSYLVALIRSHVRHDPPMPRAELDMLKSAVNVLSALNRTFAAHADGATGSAQGIDIQTALQDTRTSVEDVRRAVADIVRGNLISWETEDA